MYLAKNLMHLWLIKNIINAMKSKTFRGGERKLDRIEEYRKHFGWETAERDDYKLTMNFDNSIPNARVLKKLNKQADTITKKFPFGMIVWLALAVVFLTLFFALKDGVLFGALDLNEILTGLFPADLPWIGTAIVNFLPILLLILGTINAFFALYHVLVFFALKLSKRTTLGEIYRVADALSGNVIDAPLAENIEPDGPLTGEIAKIADKIGNRS